ncbi:hypothetical protein ACFW9N_19750 [Streptomyces sp. NPDC059496]
MRARTAAPVAATVAATIECLLQVWDRIGTPPDFPQPAPRLA